MFGKNVKKNFLKKVKDMNKEYIRKMTLESILNDSFFENEIDDYSYEDYGLLKEKRDYPVALANSPGVVLGLISFFTALQSTDKNKKGRI